jgi:hypothetical protein
MYTVLTKEGSLIPLCKRLEGTYLIDGALEFLNREMQHGLIRQLYRKLLYYKSNKIIFQAPLPAISMSHAAKTRSI